LDITIKTKIYFFVRAQTTDFEP